MLFVGLPCQIYSIKKIKSVYDLKEKLFATEKMGLDRISWFKDIDITIGLFCKENFRYEGIKSVIEKHMHLKDLRKISVEKGRVRLYSKSREFEISVNSLTNCVPTGCRICADFSSTFADLSVGSIGSPKGWSTVITRSVKGEELLEQGEKNSYIETMDIGNKNIEKIDDMDKNKIKKAKGELKEYFNKFPILYSEVKKVRTSDLLNMSFVQNYSSLFSNIIYADMCILCGSCAASCPTNAIKMRGGLPYFEGSCFDSHDGDCGACFISCPKTDIMYGADGFQLSEKFARQKDEFKRKVVAVRASDRGILKHSQDGGAVTALAKCAMEKGFANRAVVNRSSENEPWKPEPYIANSSKELLDSCKSKYSLSSPFVVLIDEALKQVCK